MPETPLVSVTHYRDGGAGFAARAREALDALAGRDGFLAGTLGRSTDDTDDWVLVTQWRNVGSYRRALGAYDVKLRATPLLGQALDGPSSFETLVVTEPDGSVRSFGSDRAGAGTPPGAVPA